MKRILVVLAFLMFSPSIFASKIDSLLQLTNGKKDSNLVRVFHDLSNAYQYKNHDSSLFYAEKGIEILQDVDWPKGDYLLDYRMCSHYLYVNNIDEALKYGNSTLKNAKKWGYKKSIALSHRLLMRVYGRLGDYAKEYESFKKAEALYTELNERQDIAAIYHNIANTLANIGRVEEALNNLKIASKINDSLQNYPWLSYNFSSIGTIYYNLSEFDSSCHYHGMGLQVALKTGQLEKITHASFNFANSLSGNKMHDSAKIYLNRTIELADSNIVNGAPGFYDEIKLYAMQIIASNFKREGNLKEAIKIREYILENAIKISDNILINGCHKSLAEMYGESKNYDKAYYHLKKYNDLEKSNEDQVSNVEQIRFDFALRENSLKDSLAFADIVHSKNLEKQELESNAKRNKTVLFGVVGVLFIVLILGIFIYKNYRSKKAFAEQLEQSKNQLEEKQNEILDSITYARRIQAAILPPIEEIKANFNDSFVMYKPKDIVAGDFYWMESIESNGIKTSFLAACDCTGHGVPGAMVSVICNGGLNRAIREYKMTEPDQILNKTRELVIQEFEKSEEEVKDGMDVSLIGLTQEADGSSSIDYAGAHNPLWIVRNGSEEIEEIKADKQPIGQFTLEKPFTPHKVKLNKGDSFYLFTDGFVDQFGGEKGKKFKAKNFKALLLSLQDKSMNDQLTELNLAFDKWKADIEQLDDVCVIGVRV